MKEFRTDDGVRIAYLDEGSGTPLVLVHGWMMSHQVWREQIRHFSRSRRVIAPDLRGCGASEARAGTYRMPRYAQDMQQLLDALDVHDATMVGWSMGGGITMEYVARHGSSRLRSVGLIDFPPRLEEDPSVADKVCASLNTKRDTFLDGFLRRMVLDANRTDLQSLLREQALRCAPETACDMYRAMRPTGPTGPQEPSALPAFLAFPAQGWFPKALPEWKQRFPEHVAPAFGASKHCPFLEEPDAFNRALDSFFDVPA